MLEMFCLTLLSLDSLYLANSHQAIFYIENSLLLFQIQRDTDLICIWDIVFNSLKGLTFATDLITEYFMLIDPVVLEQQSDD